MRRLDYQGNFTGDDAALIAAAPDLLDACERLVSWCDKNEPTGEALYFVRLARDAVVKARGYNAEVSRSAPLLAQVGSADGLVASRHGED